MQNLLALAPVSGLGKGNLFGLAGFRNGDLFLGQSAFADVVDGANGINDAFQEGVRCQTVCAVDARRGDFAAGVQALDFGPGPSVDQYASAHVMCGGHHRNPLLGDIDTGFKALGVNVGEVALDVFRRAARKINEHVRLAEALHFAVDGTGHDIAGGQGMQRVHLVHEFFTLVVLQDSAEAAHRFRN